MILCPLNINYFFHTLKFVFFNSSTLFTPPYIVPATLCTHATIVKKCTFDQSNRDRKFCTLPANQMRTPVDSERDCQTETAVCTLRRAVTRRHVAATFFATDRRDLLVVDKRSVLYWHAEKNSAQLYCVDQLSRPIGHAHHSGHISILHCAIAVASTPVCRSLHVASMHVTLM